MKILIIKIEKIKWHIYHIRDIIIMWIKLFTLFLRRNKHIMFVHYFFLFFIFYKNWKKIITSILNDSYVMALAITYLGDAIILLIYYYAFIKQKIEKKIFHI